MTYHHLSVLVQRQAEKYADKIALKYRDYQLNQWISVTWNQFSNAVNRSARALAALGVKEESTIGIFSQNKPECFYVDFGNFGNRGVTIPLYATSSVAQVVYIVKDAKIRYLFVGEQYQYDVAFKAMSLCEDLERLIIFDPAVKRDPRDVNSLSFEAFLELGNDEKYKEIVADRTSRASADDLANILYTSGTTGEPKGVMLHHTCYLQALKIHDIRLPEMCDEDVSMCFLPLTHVFERAWSYYCIHKGSQVCLNLKPADIQSTIKEIRPTVMCSVPRFWEKVYAGVQEKIEATTGFKKTLMMNAIRVGKIYNVDYRRVGKVAPLSIRIKYKFYEKTVFSLLKKTIGIENGKFFPVAGAPLADEINVFVHSVGIDVLLGYGLTESTATVCFQDKTGYIIGAVGKIMPEVEVKIGENDEILLKGKTITKGYYNKPKANEESFIDGWFRTGDAGRLEGDRLFLTDRIKDLYKTSNGKYIAPQAIETKLVTDKYIDQISVIADRRKYVTALIVPTYKQVEEFAKAEKIEYDNMAQLLSNPKVEALFKQRIDLLQQEFAHFEQIKRFTLLLEPFSMEKGELTNTLKICRSALLTNYADEIEAMYKD